MQRLLVLKHVARIEINVVQRFNVYQMTNTYS
jgi:hypothetical protein